jgi:hypothetical protein
LFPQIKDSRKGDAVFQEVPVTRALLYYGFHFSPTSFVILEASASSFCQMTKQVD